MVANSARPNEESDNDLFLAEVGDAKPLRDRDRASAERESRPAPARTTIALTVDRDGETVEGRAHGVTRAQIADLRKGRLRCEATVDLHHDDRASAQRRLRRFIDDSAGVGRRCVLVIHGRGIHSDDGPVLKEAVIAWLSAGPDPVRAFCTAQARDGGAGATYVWLAQA